MRWWRLAVAAGVVGAVPLIGGAPAGASLESPCQASGTVIGSGDTSGKTYEAATTDKAEIPRKGEVEWAASIPGGGEERDITGEVRVEFPPPIGQVKVGDWNGPSSTYSNSDVYVYDIPSVLAGFDIPVSGFHSEPGINCAGAVIVRFEGGGLSNPLAIASLVFTVLSIVNVGIAMRARPR